MGGHTGVVQLLVARGAVNEAKICDGLVREMSASEVAILYEELECIQVGTVVSTPLFLACENWYLDDEYAILRSHPNFCCIRCLICVP
jgi:hypothetical protein